MKYEEMGYDPADLEPKRPSGKICGNCGSRMITEDDGIHETFTCCPTCGDC